MSMIKYLQLPQTYNAAAMQQEVARLLSKEWKLHYNTRDYTGEWSALPLRSAGGSMENIIAHSSDAAVFSNTALMSECPYIKEVTDSLLCPKLSVRLLKLNAGAVINSHSDKDLYFEEGEIRLHIPVITNDGVEFFLDDEQIVMKEGECWYMNLTLPHRAHNKSEAARIHLVIDCEVNDWVRTQFTGDAVKNKKLFPGIVKPAEDPVTIQRTIEALRMMNTETSNKLADEMEIKLHAK